MSVVKHLGGGYLLVPFEGWHSEVMDIRGEGAMNSEFYARSLMAPTMGPCVTLYSPDRMPIASFGLMMVVRGTAEVWVLASKDISKKPKILIKAARWALSEGCIRYSIYRVQASIDKDHVVRRKWAEHMGFHVEGLMPRFGPDGETFVRYVRFMDEGKKKAKAAMNTMIKDLDGM